MFSAAGFCYVDAAIKIAVVIIFVLQPSRCLMFKLQLAGVLMSKASRAICPYDRDTNDDPSC